jgi:predicted HAD superfamily Cof-like phosphohydrolase
MYIKKVEKFHKLFDCPILDSPTIIDEDRFNLRVNLIKEELQELVDAHNNKDLVEVFDALCDLQYVLSGAILELGCSQWFDDAFLEVHASNMSKACGNIREAEETVQYYKEHKDTEAYIVPKGNKYLVLRKSDNKVLKSVNYQAVDLSGYIDNYIDL